MTEPGTPAGSAARPLRWNPGSFALCDAFDAMTHRRPWRGALSIQVALNEVKRCAGGQFDPLLARAFVDLIQHEFWQHDDFDAFLSEGANDDEYVRVRARMELLIAPQ